jgi:hypothetical protein
LSIIFLLVQDLIYEPADAVLAEINSLPNSTCLTQNMTQCVLDIILKYKSENNAELPFHFEKSFLYAKLVEFKLEVLSLALAYVTLSARYGSVYWYTNKCLSYIIAVIGLFCTIEQLFQLYIFIYISKQIIYTNLSNLVQQKLKADDIGPASLTTLIITEQYKLVLLYSFLSVSVATCLVPIYSFSYIKYKERFFIEETLFVRTMVGDLVDTNKRLRKGSTVSVNKLEKSNFIEANKIERNLSVSSSVNLINQNRGCFNYCPHLVATLQLVLICALKLPFSYDLIIYFNNYKDIFLMLSIIDEIVHTIILLLVWLVLTLKTEWEMHLRTSFSICHWTYHLKLGERERDRESEAAKSIDKCDAESELFNSESMYRNQIRKSSRHLLQRNSASIVPAYVRPENRLNRLSQPVAYFSSSTPSNRYTQPPVHTHVEIPIVKTPNTVLKQLNQNVPSSAHQPGSLAPVKPVLYLKRGPASEYESRV